MKVEVLTTPDCYTCHKLEDMLKKFGIKYTKIDVTSYPDYLIRYPIFTAPALVIDGKLIHAGIPSEKKLSTIFETNKD